MTNTRETPSGTDAPMQATERPHASHASHAPHAQHAPHQHHHRRTRYLVDWRYQLRHSAASLFVVGTLLAGLNVALLAGGLPSSAPPEGAGGGSTALGTGYGTRVLTLIVGSMLVMAAFIVVRVLETHRTTGSKLSIVRGLERVRSGQFATWVALREDDDLHDLEAAANAMILSLSQRARTQAHRLDVLAGKLAVDTAGGNYEVAGALRQLAAEQRALAGDVAPQEPERARALEQFTHGVQDEPAEPAQPVAGMHDSLANAIIETGPQPVAAPAVASAAAAAASRRDALAAEVLDELDAMAAREAMVGAPAGARDRE